MSAQYVTGKNEQVLIANMFFARENEVERSNYSTLIERWVKLYVHEV